MEIHWRHPDVLPLERQLEVEDELQRLARGRSDLIDVWIELDKSRHHRLGEDRAKIRCMAREVEIVAEGRGDDVERALREALTDFEREVRRRRDKREGVQRRPTKNSETCAELGVVERVFVQDGYGFVVTQSGEQVYFHRNALNGGLSIDALEEGQQVALGVEPGDKGPQATFVEPRPPEIPGA